MLWSEVAAVHRSVTGIGTTDGVPTSILCNPAKSGQFPDIVGETRITYYVNGPSKTMFADKLIAAIGTGRPMRVFEKVGMNNWRDLGDWTPTDMRVEQRGYTAIGFSRC